MNVNKNPASAFKFAVLYPYHDGHTDPSKLVELMKDTPEVEIRIRKMEWQKS